MLRQKQSVSNIVADTETKSEANTEVVKVFTEQTAKWNNSEAFCCTTATNQGPKKSIIGEKLSMRSQSALAGTPMNVLGEHGLLILLHGTIVNALRSLLSETTPTLRLSLLPVCLINKIPYSPNLLPYYPKMLIPSLEGT